MLKSLPKTKIRDVVVERLKSHIIAEGLMPGDRLPNEAELAVMFGVSRLSLREATKSLELLGIVESKTGVGLTVGHIDIARIAGHLGFHPALQRTPLSQLVDTRVIVETGALPYAFLRMADDPKILETLQNIVDQFRIARDFQEWVNLDHLFHRTLLSASGLAPLVAFNEVIEIFFQRFRDSVKSAEWDEAIDRHQRTIDSHQRIIDAIRAQDVQLACRELRHHIEYHLVKVDESVRPAVVAAISPTDL